MKNKRKKYVFEVVDATSGELFIVVFVFKEFFKVFLFLQLYGRKMGGNITV